jgi:hypothetical protein
VYTKNVQRSSDKMGTVGEGLWIVVGRCKTISLASLSSFLRIRRLLVVEKTLVAEPYRILESSHRLRALLNALG